MCEVEDFGVVYPSSTSRCEMVFSLAHLRELRALDVVAYAGVSTSRHTAELLARITLSGAFKIVV